MKKNNEINKKADKKTGFSLAEILITLVAIGVIAAIAMPLIGKAKPDKNVMKFKKADETLKNAIHELIVSDKYYMDGDLGKKPDGSYVEDGAYFCNTFSDVVSIKSNNCLDGDKKLTSHESYFSLSWSSNDWDNLSRAVDTICKRSTPVNEIITTDGVMFYETGYAPFGIRINDYYYGYYDAHQNELAPEVQVWMQSTARAYYQKNDIYYDLFKVFCLDIDGVPEGATESNCINECPFGYGIAVDGKVVTGKRADEWLEKDFNGKDPSEQGGSAQ